MPESHADIPGFVHDELHKLGFELPAEMLQNLAAYLDLLLETNERFNLTGIRDRDDAWRRNILDSLTPLPALADVPEEARLVDVGSGGGLPGIPLAITRPDLHFTLLEATGKKARFLEQCAQQLPLPNVAVLNQRAEVVGQDWDYRQKFDVALCRAVGPMRVLLEFVLPLVREGGLMIAMKGPAVERELADAGDALQILGAGEVQVFDAYPEGFEMNTVIVVISKEGNTPGEYPRRPGEPKLNPL